MCAPALHEPLALYGPLAMNTMDEIITALDEIDAGTFVKVEQRYAD
jgi:redox-sensitive bicupin YhaK (pirin superfamily)